MVPIGELNVTVNKTDDEIFEIACHDSNGAQQVGEI